MRKILLALLLIPSVGMAQESLLLEKGSQSFGFSLLVPERDFVWGFGMSGFRVSGLKGGLINSISSFTAVERESFLARSGSLFVLLGQKLGSDYFSARRSRFIWTFKFGVGVNTRYTNYAEGAQEWHTMRRGDHSLLIGTGLTWACSPAAVSLGWDNFGGATVGLGVTLGKS